MTAASATPQQMRDRLLQAIDSHSNIRNMVAVLEVISHLEKYPITKEALEETRLGKLVNDVRKKTKDEDLAKRAKKLLRNWQKLIEPGPNEPPARGVGPGTPGSANGGAHPCRTDATPPTLSPAGRPAAELKSRNDFHNTHSPKAEKSGRKRKAEPRDAPGPPAKASKTAAYERIRTSTPPPTNGIGGSPEPPPAPGEPLENEKHGKIPINAVRPRPSSPGLQLPAKLPSTSSLLKAAVMQQHAKMEEAAAGGGAGQCPPRSPRCASFSPRTTRQETMARPASTYAPKGALPSPAPAPSPSSSSPPVTSPLPESSLLRGGPPHTEPRLTQSPPLRESSRPTVECGGEAEVSGRGPSREAEVSGRGPSREAQVLGRGPSREAEVLGRGPSREAEVSGRGPSREAQVSGRGPSREAEVSGRGPSGEAKVLGRGPSCEAARPERDGLEGGKRRKKKYRPRDYTVNLGGQAEERTKPVRLKERRLTFDPVTGQIKPLTHKESHHGGEEPLRPETLRTEPPPLPQPLPPPPPGAPLPSPFQQTNWKELSRNEIIQFYLNLQSDVLTCSGAQTPGAHFFMSEYLKGEERHTKEGRKTHVLVPSGSDTGAPGVSREVTPADLRRVSAEHWPGVNGCCDTKDNWYDWTQCISLDPHGDESKLNILPYVCLD